MDAPRLEIYENLLDSSHVFFLHEMMDTLCEKYGFEFLDLTIPMKRDYDLNKIHFESPYDAHWNEYGHEFVCEQVLMVLE